MHLKEIYDFVYLFHRIVSSSFGDAEMLLPFPQVIFSFVFRLLIKEKQLIQQNKTVSSDS